MRCAEFQRKASSLTQLFVFCFLKGNRKSWTYFSKYTKFKLNIIPSSKTLAWLQCLFQWDQWIMHIFWCKNRFKVKDFPSCLFFDLWLPAPRCLHFSITLQGAHPLYLKLLSYIIFKRSNKHKVDKVSADLFGFGSWYWNDFISTLNFHETILEISTTRPQLSNSIFIPLKESFFFFFLFLHPKAILSFQAFIYKQFCGRILLAWFTFFFMFTTQYKSSGDDATSV